MNRSDLAGLPAHARAEVERQMNEKSKAKTAHAKPLMNKWERAYADMLDSHIRAGVIKCWYFEAVKFRLANRCWYCPDFLVQLSDETWQLREVKGFWRDDAKVKVKVMAEAFPFPLVIVGKQKGGMGWTYEPVATRSNP